MSNVFVYGTLMAEEVVDVLIRRQPKKVQVKYTAKSLFFRLLGLSYGKLFIRPSATCSKSTRISETPYQGAFRSRGRTQVMGFGSLGGTVCQRGCTKHHAQPNASHVA